MGWPTLHLQTRNDLKVGENGRVMKVYFRYLNPGRPLAHLGQKDKLTNCKVRDMSQMEWDVYINICSEKTKIKVSERNSG